MTIYLRVYAYLTLEASDSEAKLLRSPGHSRIGSNFGSTTKRPPKIFTDSYALRSLAEGKDPMRSFQNNQHQIISDIRSSLFGAKTPQSPTRNPDMWPRQSEYQSRITSSTKKLGGFKSDSRVNTPLSAIMSQSKTGKPFYRKFTDFKQFKEDVIRRGQMNSNTSQ